MEEISEKRQMQALATQNQRTNATSSTSSYSSSYPLFNREMERKYLEDHCATCPDSISIVLGPINAGKTALLREFMRDQGSTDSRCYIDARSTPITSPKLLAIALLRYAIPSIVQQLFSLALSELQDKLEFGAQADESTFTVEALSSICKSLYDDTGKVAPFADVIAGYSALLDAWDKARAAGQLEDSRPPVLVLDEADVLMPWDDQYKVERQALLRFFVAISKAQKHSHVLLVTSDGSFNTWLAQEIRPFDSKTFVIGDFPASEARQFLDDFLQQIGGPEVSDADWEAVYEVCGGNAGALIRAANARLATGDWKAALPRVTIEVWRRMKRGYMPAIDAAYTAADYATAVDAILNSPFKAVDEEDLEAKLGQQSLEAMVQADQLALRPYSSWAKDIDPAAFGPDLDVTVVTAPTATHLYLMGRKRDRILAALNK